MMISALPPALILILGALLIPLLKGRIRQGYILALPLVAYADFLLLPQGLHWSYTFLEFQIHFVRLDPLSNVFAHIFLLMACIGALYNLKADNNLEYMACSIYAGSAVGAVLAGDLLTLFVFWEMLTLGSVFILLARRGERARGAALRYLLVHVFGGLILLAGVVLQIQAQGSTDFSKMTLAGLPAWLIFFGFGLNCAWPLMHAWLSDTYPEASLGGIVFMATFTTKTAVYALARGFPGTELLLWMGVLMATFPIFYAVIENDLRRVLAYSLINQVGFMVIGIGVGTELAINGVTAHVVSDVLFKGLLFMSLGAVMYRNNGRVKATELGGLYRSMPWTCAFCIIGAASISAFPLFCGFASKSMIMSAVSLAGHPFMWLALLFASAGVFHHAGIKIPFFTFFGHDSGLRCKEAPLNMLIAMGITGSLCILIGTFPHQTFYQFLPYPVTYEPYTTAHVVAQLQVLFFSALAFVLLLLSGIYPAEIRSVNLDADWFYRKGARGFYWVADKGLNGINAFCHRVFVQGLTGRMSRFFATGPARILQAWATPYLLVRGLDQDRRHQVQQYLYRNVQSSAFPIGLTAFMAIVFLAVLFLKGIS